MQKGFTLLELMVVLSLTAILSVVGVSQLATMNSNAENSMAAQLFSTDIMRAKFEASSRGCRVIVKQAANGLSYTIGPDCSPYSAVPTADSILTIRFLPTNMLLSMPVPIIFDSRGFHIDVNGALTTTSATLSRSGSVLKVFSVDTLGGVS